MNGIPTNNTTVTQTGRINEPAFKTTVRLHSTDIVEVEEITSTYGIRGVTLNSGGYRTPTTKRRRNQVFEALEIPLRVYQKGLVWYVEIGERPWHGDNGPVVFKDGITIYI